MHSHIIFQWLNLILEAFFLIDLVDNNKKHYAQFSWKYP